MGRLVKIQPPLPKADDRGFVNEVNDPNRETYMEQVVKYIPAEIVAGYVAMNGFLATLTGKMLVNSLWISFAVFAILTPIYFWKLSKPGDATARQIILSSISFVLWAYSITGAGGIFGPIGLDIYYSQLSSALLVLFSLLAPLFTPRREA